MAGPFNLPLQELFIAFLVYVCVSFPLSLWKLIEILIWVFKHVRIEWGTF